MMKTFYQLLMFNILKIIELKPYLIFCLQSLLPPAGSCWKAHSEDRCFTIGAPRSIIADLSSIKAAKL